MQITMPRDMKPIKNGWSARARVGLVAHGMTAEIADLNLERTIRLFFTPFARTGTLVAELDVLRVPHEGDGPGITVRLIEPPASPPPHDQG